MRSRLTKGLVALAAASALAVPAVAQASHGSDDPIGHVRHEHHRGDFKRHSDRPDRDRGDRHDNDRHDNDRNDDHGGDR
jgi:Spy/CpxP family protein refolding chaperone